MTCRRELQEKIVNAGNFHDIFSPFVESMFFNYRHASWQWFFISVNFNLSECYISACQLIDTDVDMIASALSLATSLKILTLDHNQIGPAGAHVLAERLQLNTSLTQLHFNFNNLSLYQNGGVDEILTAMHFDVILTTLDISWQTKYSHSHHARIKPSLLPPIAIWPSCSVTEMLELNRVLNILCIDVLDESKEVSRPVKIHRTPNANHDCFNF